ncbi:PolC-type DNA polymerase III [uncultured Ilumatobacter sp.]|uniref:3'-5' exonuclease n=1 Tax=uncultured Ilumatobacter sp. TaxID=879968 RepID=UPI00374EB2A4
MPLPRFAVVDVETSGLSQRRDRILQIGAVIVESDGREIDRWSTLVRLRWPLQRVGPTDIHGITRPMLRDAPRMSTALDELTERLDGAVFTAHNAQFDAGFIERAARRRSGFDLGPRLCTLRMSRRLDPDREQSHRLIDVADRFGVPLVKPHDALADAAATAGVLPHLLAAHGITNASQLSAFFDR